MKNTAEVLGCRIDPLTMAATLNRIEDFIHNKQTAHIITLNAEIAYQAYSDTDLQDLINRAQIVTPDGIGIVWGARQLGVNVPERVTGIDLMEQLCQRAARQGWNIYLLGAAPGVAQAAALKLQQKYPGLIIAGIQHGYFDDAQTEQVVADIARSKPDILFIGLGAPRQEWWIDQHKERLKVPVLIGVGGSLDVISGQKQRAPQWMINYNLEWLYRLMAEPSRYKRQLVLPRFAWLITKTRLSKKL